MNHFMLPSEQRLQTWIQFREGLAKLDENAQLNEVVKFWSLCPFGKWFLDLDSNKWPSIWEIISGGDYCKNTIAYGMAETLRLAGWNPERMALTMIKNNIDGEEFFALIIDDTQVLNYAYGELVTIGDLKDGEVTYARKWNGRQFIKAT